MLAGVSEEKAGEDAGGEQEHGVFGKQAEANGRADEEEVAGIGGTKEFDYEESGEDPEEVIERSVLHEGAGAEGKGDGGGGGNELRETAAAHVFSHAARKEDACGLQEGGEETEADEGSAEQDEGKTREEGSEGRVGSIAPGEMAGVFEEGEFVAVEAVATCGEEMEEDGGGGEEEEKDEIGAGLLREGCRRARLCGSGGGGGEERQGDLGRKDNRTDATGDS